MDLLELIEAPRPDVLATLGLHVPDWYQDAACQNADPDIFIPSKGEPAAPAIAVCETCPVRVECLDYAISFESKSAVYVGIWGGHTPKERRRLARMAG